jgi:hypothetical protein
MALVIVSIIGVLLGMVVGAMGGRGGVNMVEWWWIPISTCLGFLSGVFTIALMHGGKNERND